VPTDPTTSTTILDRSDIERTLDRLASDIASSVPAERPLVLVGIQRRGDLIAGALARRLSASRGSVPTGSLDITMYRDDFAQIGALPMIGTSDIQENIDDAHVIIVDDVLYTGRTIRAALNELADFGRAAKVELCVLVDRGGRQLPIQPDYAGERVDVPVGREVAVKVEDLDGVWAVDLVDLGAE
jgi:pyrimidine operon attenuation protein/uracil phosphoribosyltransferase